MTITFLSPPIPLAVGSRRCLNCVHWGKTPSMTAPANWKKCRIFDCDRSPGATCPSFEPNPVAAANDALREESAA